MSTDSDDNIIQNAELKTLYSQDFGNQRYFYVVFSNDDEVGFRISTRTLMRIKYLKEQDSIEGLELMKVVDKKDKQSLKFYKFDIQQLKCFLNFINSLDFKEINERKIILADKAFGNLDEQTILEITKLLSADGGETVKKLLNEGVFTNQDLVNTGYRKKQLEMYKKLLYDDYLDEYKKTIGKPNTKDELAWQHFFNQNQWIFGYGMDYRFQGILQKEFSASDTDAAGGENVKSDFLLGDNNFTTFVELKLPTTELFGVRKNRSNSWKLSDKLIDSFSQILEHKASGQLKIETAKDLFDDKGRKITQRSYDSKAILVIGSWNQVKKSSDSDAIKKIKTKTFELFRRDSRNIEILTFDELYDRAKFITEQ